VDALDLVLHPVRLRIVHAMWGNGTQTTTELCTRFPNVARATMYRHMAALLEGGVVDVVEERRVKGAVERTYRLNHETSVINPALSESMSTAERRRALIAALAVLAAEFYADLEVEGEPLPDSRTVPLWLSDAELESLTRKLHAAVESHLDNEPDQGRRGYLFSPVFFPFSEA
jgi:DNA-binding transcriptional ArsR family regulator